MVPADESTIEIAAQPAQTAELEDQLRLLREIIDRLSDFDKALILLYLDENPYDVIAEVLGISESNVGTRIHRIKDKLQRRSVDLSRKERCHGIR